MKIVDVRLTIVNVPKTSPEIWVFGSSHGLTNILLEVVTDEGIVGLGEMPGTPSLAVAHEALRRTIPLAVGEDPFQIRAFARKCWMNGWHHYPHVGNMATAAVEIALWDIAGKATNQPISNLFGGIQSEWVPYYAHIPIADRQPETARREAAEAVRQGFGTVYFKVGFDLEKDVALVRAVRDEVGPRVAVRVDANESWTVFEATRALQAFDDLNLEFVEQPIDMNDLEGSIHLRNKSRTPLAANQSSWLLHQIPVILARQAADVIVADPHALGGLQAFRDAATLCELARVPFIKHSFGDLGVTTAAALHVLGGLNPPALAHQTHLGLLEHDLVMPRFEFSKGRLRVPRGPGLGIELDPDAVRHYSGLFDRNGEFEGGYGASAVSVGSG